MIVKTLKDVSLLLHNSQIPYMVMGGQAVVIYGKPRFTQDIDITVGLSIDEFKKVQDALSKAFRVLPENVEEFIQQTWVLPVEHKETKVRVDIVFSITPFEREAIAKAKNIKIEDFFVKYILPEYLVVQKIIAGRARDLEDARGVIEIQSEKIDITEIEKLIKLLGKGEEGKEWLKRWRKLKKGLRK